MPDPAHREPGVFIHEDLVGMRNLHPLAAEAEVAADIDASIQASERHRVPDGVGWTQISEIQPPNIDFTTTGLTTASAAAALEVALPRLLRFHSGSLSSRGSDPFAVDEYEAHCYGFDADCFVKLETRAEAVVAVWFDLAPGASPERREALRAALVAFDRQAPCLIADYWISMTGRVGDTRFLDRYFKAL